MKSLFFISIYITFTFKCNEEEWESPCLKGSIAWVLDPAKLESFISIKAWKKKKPMQLCLASKNEGKKNPCFIHTNHAKVYSIYGMRRRNKTIYEATNN